MVNANNNIKILTILSSVCIPMIIPLAVISRIIRPLNIELGSILPIRLCNASPSTAAASLSTTSDMSSRGA